MDEEYQKIVTQTVEKMKAAGIQPCPAHGWVSMNWNGTCETCKKEDFPEDFAGTE